MQGAETSAALYSLVETVKLNHLKIYEYFEYLLSHAMEMNLKEPTEVERYIKIVEICSFCRTHFR